MKLRKAERPRGEQERLSPQVPLRRPRLGFLLSLTAACGHESGHLLCFFLFYLNGHWRTGVFRYVNGVGMSPRALCRPGGGARWIWPHPSSSGRSSSSEILHLRWDQRDMVDVERSGQAIFVLCFLERGPSAVGTTQWQHAAGEGTGFEPS